MCTLQSQLTAKPNNAKTIQIKTHGLKLPLQMKAIIAHLTTSPAGKAYMHTDTCTYKFLLLSTRST